MKFVSKSCLLTVLLFLLLIRVNGRRRYKPERKPYNPSLFLSHESKPLHDLRNLLADLLLKMGKKSHCTAFILDYRHSRVFTQELVANLNKLTYFVVSVKFGEDLLSPNYNTVESIERIRHDGCESYVILIQDAFETIRLLKFGDRHRVLDTRARYVLLHDFRLLAPQQHYLWSRIVRVLFLRRFAPSGRGAGNVEDGTGESHRSAWYELSTVPYPARVRGVLVLRRVDWWRKGGFRSGLDLFRDKTRNLAGHPMHVVVLPHIPAVFRGTKDIEIGQTREMQTVTVYTGLEIELVRALSRAMNFTVEVYEPADGEAEFWGRELPNGSFTGLLGEMTEGHADFAVADLHYTPYNLKQMDLSLPYGTECLTFLTPEALFDNSWMTLILPFKPVMWLAVMLALVVLGFVFYALAKYQMHVQDDMRALSIKKDKDYEDEPPQGLYVFGEFVNSLLYTWSMLLVVSLPRLPSGWSLRMLTGWYWMYCVLVVCSYRASLTAILANPVPRIRIDTLEQLADSPIGAGGWGEQFKEFFLTSLDVAGQRIGAKFESVDNATDAVERIARGQFAYYENEHYLRKLIVTRQKVNKERGITPANNAVERNLHIMDKCVINMPISIGLQKNSPLKKRADRFLRRVIESGLSEKWLSDIMEPIRAAEVVDQPQEALMDLRKLYGALIALGAGYAISILALIGEIIYWKCVVQKRPDFDKYAMKEYYVKISK